ncbi:MAG: PspC domain-containing protein [Bacteroidales bacterium]|nr:PspC domain-containing protein [Bacteroidales bacterium]
MKKAMQISLGGIHFHIDEDAYTLLKEYTDSLREYFSNEGEAGNEIIDDIEQRMAELLNVQISGTKQVVSLTDVKQAIDTLGKIEDFEFNSPGSEKTNEEEDDPGTDRKDHRRLYRDPDNSVLGGVCGGLGAYFNIDPLIVRILFILMLFINVIIPPFISLFGFGVLLYLILWIAVPKARTTAQKLQMHGEPVTVENIKRSVNDEYQKVKSSVKNIGSSDGFKKGVTAVEEIFKTLGNIILAILKVFVYIIGIAFLITGILLLAGIVTFTFTRHQWFHRFDWPQVYLPDLTNFFSDPNTLTIVIVCIIVLIAIPVISLIIWGIKLMTNVRGSNRVLQATTVTIWVIALFVLITLVFTEGNTFAFQASSTDVEVIEYKDPSTLYLEVKESKDEMEGITVYSIFDYDIYYDKTRDKILGVPELKIRGTDQENIELVVQKSMRNINAIDADEILQNLDYKWHLKDSVLVFDHYFRMDEENKWRFAEVELILRIPKGKKINLSENMSRLVTNFWINDSVGVWEVYNKTLIRESEGFGLAE